MWLAQSLRELPNGDCKGFFTTRFKGGCLLMPDLSAAEIRMVAGSAHEDTMIQAFKDGLDIHNFNASKIFNIPIDQVNKNQRKIAKGVSFGILYGSTVKALALNYFKGDVNKAQKLLDDFFTGFPKLNEFIDKKHKEAATYGYVTSYTDRILYIEPQYKTDRETNSETEDTSSRDRRAQNFPIQGGCLLGDTQIKLLNGTSIRIDELNKLSEDERWIYAYDSEMNRIVPAQFTNPHITKYVKEYMKVTLDNGSIFKTTVDHRFMLKDRTYLEARNLSIGDRLMPLNTYVSNSRRYGGYEVIVHPDGTKTFTHMTTQDGTRYKKSKTSEKHHIDFNKLNNLPSNLEDMDIDKHKFIHLKKIFFENLDFYKKHKGFKTLTRIFENDEINKLKYINKTMVDISYSGKYRIERDFDLLFNVLRQQIEFYLENDLPFNTIEEWDKSAELFKKEQHRKYSSYILQYCSWDTFINDCEEYLQCYKVPEIVDLKVVTLDEEIPVYDITVPKYNNFAITTNNRIGVIVHNSEDVAGWIDYNIGMYLYENNLLSKTVMFIHDSFEIDTFPTELFTMIKFCDKLINHDTPEHWQIPMSSDVVIGPSIGQEIEVKTIDLKDILTSQDESLKELKTKLVEQKIMDEIIATDSDVTKWHYIKLDCPASGPGTIEDVNEMVYGIPENPNGWISAYKKIIEINVEENHSKDQKEYISWNLLMQGSHAPLKSNFGEYVTKGVREYIILNELRDDYWDGYEEIKQEN